MFLSVAVPAVAPFIAAVHLTAVAAVPPAEIERRLADATRLERSGRTTDALTEYRSLLPLVAAKSASRAAILEALAGLETNAGQYAAAVRHAIAAATIRGDNHDERRRGAALNLAGLALLYSGDYATAETVFGNAIAASTAAGDDAGRAEQITNLANVYLYLGRYADAAAGYESALRITDAHRDQNWTARRRHILLVNQATLDQRLGLDQQALALYKQVQSDGTQLRPREQAQILANLGVLYRHLGDPIKALSMYDAARDLFSREQQLDGELGVMKNRGIVLALDLGRLDEARSTFSEALNRATKAGNRREMLQAQLYRGETELRAGALEEARSDFQSCVDAARTLGTPEEEWKALYGLGRTELRLGDTDAASADLRTAIRVIEGVREAIRVPLLKSDFFSDKRDVYDALIAVSLEHMKPAELFELIERSHSRAWRDLLGLTEPVTASRVQRELPADAVLLDCWSSPFGAAVAEVTRSGISVRRIVVDEGAIRRLDSALSSGPSNEWRKVAAAVGPGLVRTPWPSNLRRVIVVPDGGLALVPFELLPAGSDLLIQRAAVSYLPTAAMLSRTAPVSRRIAPPWKRELVAFGNPVFGSSPLDRGDAVRTRAAASADEVRWIAREIGGRASIHLGADDRKAWLYDRQQLAPILHIASHAAADVSAMEKSRILFSPAAARSSHADYLFLKEAYSLPLRGVELAVLSACDTERGAMLRGEGVQSFSRTFLAAGARSTVTTLWRVPDRETASFMRIFYYHLQRGASRAEALRSAKLRFLLSGTAGADPHYWAAFVLNGEGDEPIPRAAKWSDLIIPTLAVAALAALVIWFIRRPKETARTA